MKYQVLSSEAEVCELISWHNANSEFVVVDIETTGLDSFKDEILDVQITGKDADSVSIFPGHLSGALRLLSCRVVGHNLRFDVTFMFRKGVDVTGWKSHDTLLLGHLLDENRESYSLDSYVKELFNDNYKEEFWKKYKTYQEAPAAETFEYGAKDTYYTRAVYKNLISRLKEGGIPDDLILHTHRLQYSLLQTEIEGIKVDVDYLVDLGVTMKAAMEELDPKMRASVAAEIDLVETQLWISKIEKYKTDARRAAVPKPSFSFGSANQLKALIYDCLQLPVQKNPKTRAISTDYDSLQKLKDSHPFIPLLLKYREYPTIYNTFIQGTLEKMRDGRIYPGFKVNGTVGARISHENPNMGNIPSEGGVKGIFVPDEGEEWSELDYAQLEVCIEAHLTQDKNLLEIVLNGASKHDITAHNLGIPRSVAKTVNFAMQYWCGPDKVAKIIGGSRADGQHAWNKFWETYSGPKKLKEYTDKCIDDGLPLVDLFGRRRRFAVRNRSPWDGDYRSGYNFIVQSSGGQLMNNSFYKTNSLLRGNKVGRAILTVHDSQLIATKKEHTAVWAPEAAKIMVEEGCLIGLTVPLKVSSNIGMPRWLDK